MKPLPNKEQPNLTPLYPSTMHTLTAGQDPGDLNIELLRMTIKRTEHGNARIRKLNEIRRQQ